MASVDNMTEVSIPGVQGTEILRAQQTGTTSTYVSRKYKKFRSVNVSVEGTNTMTYTWTGATITITGTNDDWVNIVATGFR